MSNRFDLEVLHKQYMTALEQGARFYELGDPNTVAVIDLGVHYERSDDGVEVSLHGEIKARVDVYARSEDLEDGKVISTHFCHTEWEGLDAGQLVRLAECVNLTTKWNQNELVGFPESTAADPRKDAHKPRRMHRRVKR